MHIPPIKKKMVYSRFPWQVQELTDVGFYLLSDQKTPGEICFLVF
jgi:hypothetical protein